MREVSITEQFYWIEIDIYTSPYSPTERIPGHAISQTFMLDAWFGDAQSNFAAPHWTRALDDFADCHFRISRRDLTRFLRLYNNKLPNARYLVRYLFSAALSTPVDCSP
jgi:hypothetical protein